MIVDHLIYTAPALDAAIDRLEVLLGVRPVAGGSHEGLGTHNALLSLGDTTYFEIIAPDPAQSPLAAATLFGLAADVPARLTTWVVRATNLDAVVGTAHAHGLDLGAVLPGRRERPDGTALTWCMTSPFAARADGIVPFFIDWGETPSPARSAPGGCRLAGLRAEHPEAARLAPVLAALDVELALTTGPTPMLVATLETPGGVVELR